ncbi:YHYH protein [Shimia sagamensis]|uniref:YHYH protein n=1 Tax=Shimia sagamensis TaxID=1566352 RepID=A0ABY1P3N2_9RHOB|nr:YHYH protein [Shimia sagamensis]SMP25768.1 YHYH protein [Shimia sagamensis]
MTLLENVKLGLLAVAIVVGAAASSDAQGRPPMRQHTATETEPLQLVKASKNAGRSKVSISKKGTKRVIRSNGIPSHKVGRFPNSGNPHRIEAQNYQFTVPLSPKKAARSVQGHLGTFGVAVNGVPFDPGAAEFWRGNPRSGWQYEALGGAVPLGLDANYAHVQPTGAYHYHGLPVGLMQKLGWSRHAESPLIGYAADGFPIYAITATVKGRVTHMTSSYRLKSGNRTGNGPSGRHDGAFVQDYMYVSGAGSLDACNGAFVKTTDYPRGTYAYFLTDTFPVIPRCHKGTPDSSFQKRRP